MTKALTKTTGRKLRTGDYAGLSKYICKLARGTQHLARQAVQEYAPVLEDILRSGCRDTRRIEQTLDGLLDFCFEPKVIALYKKLCRYYYDIDPTSTVSYVQFYREMWDSKEELKG